MATMACIKYFSKKERVAGCLLLDDGSQGYNIVSRSVEGGRDVIDDVVFAQWAELDPGEMCFVGSVSRSAFKSFQPGHPCHLANLLQDAAHSLAEHLLLAVRYL